MELFTMEDIYQRAANKTGRTKDEVKKQYEKVKKILVEKAEMKIKDDVEHEFSKVEADFFVQLIHETYSDFFMSYLIKGKRNLLTENNNLEKIHQLARDFYNRLQQTYAISDDKDTIEILNYINLSLVHEITSPVLTKNKLFEDILEESSDYSAKDDEKKVKEYRIGPNGQKILVVASNKSLESFFDQITDYLTTIKYKRNKNTRNKLNLTIHDVMFLRALLIEMTYDKGFLRKLIDQNKHNINVVEITDINESYAFYNRMIKSLDYAFDENIKREIEEIINSISGKERFEVLGKISNRLDMILKEINERDYDNKNQKTDEFERFYKYLEEYR